jgi:hypothetical protein
MRSQTNLSAGCFDYVVPGGSGHKSNQHLSFVVAGSVPFLFLKGRLELAAEPDI